jgi:hypothetical protein
MMGMDGSAPASAPLATLSDARMTRLSHPRQIGLASAPLNAVHMDVVSVSKLDLPGAKTDSALRLGMKYAIVYVDDYSRLKKV